MSKNEKRVNRMCETLEFYTHTKGEAYVDETDVSDILTDLMHWCAFEGIDIDDHINMARIHYAAEIGGEE